MPKHTLSVLVENRPGVLARTTALFSRRGFNIESLAEGTTLDPGISRITLVVDVEDRLLEQVVKQIGKLVNVIRIVVCDGDAAIRRGLLLVNVEADRETRPRIVEVARMFHARVVDTSRDALTIEAVGTCDELRTMLRRLQPFGIRELVQSGTLAIGRASGSAPSGAAARPIRQSAAPANDYRVSA